jgi:endonuclease G, mitochondrial
LPVLAPRRRFARVNIRTLGEAIRETESRFAEREGPRAEYLRRLEEGGVLATDDPDRVEERLRRLRTDRPTAEAVQQGAVPASDPGYVADPPGEVEGADIPVVPGETNYVALERLLGSNNLIGVGFLEAGYRASIPVGRIQVLNEQGGIATYGTGTLVSPRLLMTNNHVLPSPETAGLARVEFGYELDPEGAPRPSASFALEPDTFFLTDKELDYALVAVAERGADGAELAAFGWSRLIESTGKVIVGEFVNIVQHPNGEPKQIAVRENQVIDLLEKFLHYQADTAQGSSGAPVFNDQWEIVALHHSGVPRRSEQSEILALGGEKWQRAMGEHRIDWVANEGARISRVVAHVKKAKLTAKQKKLRAGIFDAEPPARPDAAEVPGREALVTVAGGRDAVPGPRDGDVVVTVPLEITIRMPAGGDGPASPAPRRRRSSR